MPERRMFTKKITDGDEFTSMPPTAQCLYFHLCMSADDDGFSNQIRISLFNAHATNDDFDTLVRKRFIIPFDSGVIVIKHWKMHNYIQNDRYHETKYVEEKSKLILKENGVYTEADTSCIQTGYELDTEVRLELGKDNKEKTDTKVSVKKKFVPPTAEEVKAYCDERHNSVDPESFVDFYTSKDWMIGKNKMKDWKSAVRTWERNNKGNAAPKEETMEERIERWRREGLWDHG